MRNFIALTTVFSVLVIIVFGSGIQGKPAFVPPLFQTEAAAGWTVDRVFAKAGSLMQALRRQDWSEAGVTQAGEGAANGEQKGTTRLTPVQQGDKWYLPLERWRPYLAADGWQVDWQVSDRVLRLERGQVSLRLVAGIPVLELSGRFQPLDASVRVSAAGGDAPLIPLGLVERLPGWRVETDDDSGDADSKPAVVQTPAADTGLLPTSRQVPQEREAIVDHLAFLQTPLEGAKPNFLASQVPGALREYRNGTHEGFDWYSDVVGIPMTPDTPVQAMADGTIVRARHGWETPSIEERQDWIDRSHAAEQTPEWLLDQFRGRQVWIMHDRGVMIRYVHLSSIPPHWEPGARVDAGEVIGYAGNSGTQAEVEHSLYGVHLHTDILIEGENVWLDFPPGVLRQMMQQILATGD